ncbi:hypothetical protein C8F01DRAFT_1288369 [Mycena amicta]|nr:hypothetical protein C8F01DRAFT_1288369 [Mycena amicta]
MPKQISPTEAQLYTQLLEAIFWGFHIVSLVFCLKALLRSPKGGWKRSKEISKVMLCVVLLMACIGTFDLGLTFAVNLNALVFYTGPGGPDAAFNNTSGWMDLMSVIDVILQISLGDVMLIYRCFIVYGRSWRAIAIPVLLAVTGLVLIILVIFFQVTLPPGAQFASPYKELTIATWAITISINIVTTGLIIYRIWRVDRVHLEVMNVASRHTYRNAQRVIIESGLMSTTVTGITVILYISGSGAFSPLTGIDIQMVAIAFNLILIRVYRNRALGEREATRTNPTLGGPGSGRTRTPATGQRSTLRFAPAFPSSSGAGDTILLSVRDSLDTDGSEANTPPPENKKFVVSAVEEEERLGGGGEEEKEILEGSGSPSPSASSRFVSEV